MKKITKKILLLFDDNIFRFIVKVLYPEYKRHIHNNKYNYQVIYRFAIAQKIFRINSSVPWPVDFRSRVIGIEGITKGILCNPGDSMGIYINGTGGISFGNNIEIGPNTIITSINHDINNPQKYSKKRGIKIGNNVWIGANCSILAGSDIGNNVTIGAGCVISSKIPDNSIVLSGSRDINIIEKRDVPINIEYGKLNQ